MDWQGLFEVFILCLVFYAPLISLLLPGESELVRVLRGNTITFLIIAEVFWIAFCGGTKQYMSPGPMKAFLNWWWWFV